ncbi:hypothetical protein Tco_0040586 [Tanacetum coccineum]
MKGMNTLSSSRGVFSFFWWFLCAFHHLPSELCSGSLLCLGEKKSQMVGGKGRVVKERGWEGGRCCVVEGGMMGLVKEKRLGGKELLNEKNREGKEVGLEKEVEVWKRGWSRLGGAIVVRCLCSMEDEKKTTEDDEERASSCGVILLALSTTNKSLFGGFGVVV